MTSTTALRQRFEELVRQAEREVAANPKRYKWRLALFVALGYVVIFASLALFMMLLGGTVVAAWLSSAFLVLLFKNKLLLFILVPIWILARSMFVRVKAPQGYELMRKEFPGVWKEIDTLRKALNALPIHKVVLTAEMNAAVTQIPNFGLVGPHRNTLVLGLELLLSLSPQEARAVLAHEFGHLSAKHGRFGAWIYRKRLTWARIYTAFNEQQAFGTGFIRHFMAWYVPRLTGYSFALARQQEYEADAVAAQLTSPKDLASALVQCHTRDEINKDAFWKPLLRRASSDPNLETKVYSLLYEHLRHAPIDRALEADKIAAAMRVRTDYSDTHPALKDRLAALNVPPAIAPVRETAAEAWFGHQLPEVLAAFDASWRHDNADGWANRHRNAKAALERLKELADKPEGELTQVEAWQLATLTEEFVPEADALAAFQGYRVKFPDDRDGDFAVGRLLLTERNDESGVEYLARATENPMLREPACSMIAAFYNKHDRHDLSESWLRKAELAYDENVEAHEERKSLAASDRFKTSDLESEAISNVVSAIKQSSGGTNIKQIWIADKEVKRFPELGVHVVLVKPNFFTRKKREMGQKLADELEQTIYLPNTWFFPVDVRDNYRLARQIKAVSRPLLG